MFFRRMLCFGIIISFVTSLIVPPQKLYAQTVLDLPVAGAMVSVSPAFEPALIRGLTVHQDNPFLFDFIVDPGQSKLSKEILKDQSERMIKYFFAALTIPDKDIWVNLSPYEKDRMIPVSLGKTAMGRDLLAQDYMLKQLTASLIYPQKALGREFWAKVYSKAKEMYGTTQIPVNTFNKVWIVPQKAGVYEHGQTAYIVSGHLKVMLEEDYLSLKKHAAISESASNGAHAVGSRIIRAIILPEIEKEVNTGKNFASLRQIFYAQVLAVWFKRNLKQALLNRVYANKGTVKGIDQNDTATNEAIYHQYLRAYKKGVFNFINEEIDPVTQETLPRKYFSGGYGDSALLAISPAQLSSKDAASISSDIDIAVLTARPKEASLLSAKVAALSAPVKTSLEGSAFNRAMASGLKGFVRQSFLSLFLLGVSASSVLGQSDNPLVSWMRNNVFEGGMPRSFEVPKDPQQAKEFWSKIGNDTVEGIIERVGINDGLNIYDGAVWQSALAMAGGQDNFKAANVLTDTLKSGYFGELSNIRGNTPFTYQGQRLPKGNAFFFRFISPHYSQLDPLNGAREKLDFPEWPQIHWTDWKPITGENAWVVIGNVQLAYAEGNGVVNVNSPQMELAQSLYPAFRQLQSPIGAVFYSPKGTYSPNEDVSQNISNENNESSHSAFRMLYKATRDPKYLEINQGIENYFKNYGYDKNRHLFYQGGSYANGKFTPKTDDIPVDVQTWAGLEFGPGKIDGWFGEGEAYKNWNAVISLSGYYHDDQLFGVGYTTGHDVHSVEWTYGAIGDALELALYYQTSHPDWSRKCLADAVSMLYGQEELKRKSDIGTSYLYANKRYNIPYGWWANPVPSLASTAWAYLIEEGKNPFELGGKTRWFSLPGFKEAVDAIKAGQSSATPVVNPAPVRNGGLPLEVPQAPAAENRDSSKGFSKVIAQEPSGSYDGADGGHNFFKDLGVEDFSGAKALKLTFPASQAGVNIAVRLLPDGEVPDYPTGLDPQAHIIPKDGVVVIPLSEFGSVLGADKLKAIKQISVHSGKIAWSLPLNADPDQKARFQTIEMISDHEAAAASTPAPMAELYAKAYGQHPVPAPAEPTAQSGVSKVIADGGPSAHYSGAGAFSVWKDIPQGYDFTGVRSIRLTFPATQAGVKIALRLLPKGSAYDSSRGLNRQVYTIGQDGQVTVPLSDFGSILSSDDLKNIIQISVCSSSMAWNLSLGQDEGKRATFQSIEALSDKASLSDINGGIDLSTQDAALHVEKDANGGVKVNVDPVLIARIEREGMPALVPVIISMRLADMQSLFGAP